MTMSWRMLWRISSAVFLFVAVLGFTALTPVAASLGGQDQLGQNSLVGTWSFVSPDNVGGRNFSWYTFTSNGQYQMVSAIQGGRNNGSVVQRWGRYQARSIGQNSYQVAVQITGGAPTQICAPGQGCTPVRGIQQQLNLSFQVNGNSLRQSDGSIFQRSSVPPQLQGQLPATRNQAAVPQSPGINNGGRTQGSATNIPGLGNNCDNAQQNRICTVNNGHMYTDNRGCRVCAGP
jgi:hypothetical protein